MSSGPTDVLYFRCAMARHVSCIVTGLVWWRISFMWVRRSGGRGVRAAELTGGKSAFHFTLVSEVGLSLEWGDGFVVGAVALDCFPDGSGCRVLELVDVVRHFCIAYICRPFAVFVLALLSVGVSEGETGSSICPFGGFFCQCEAVVPPGCLRLPLTFVRDGGFCGLVDEEGDVADCTEGSFRALEV